VLTYILNPAIGNQIRKVMRGITKILILLMALIFLFSACKKYSPNSNSIIGKWELANHNVTSNGQLAYNFDYQKGESVIYHFALNNTYTLSAADSILENGTYKLDSNRLSLHCIIRPGYEISGTFNSIISNTTLTLFNNGQDMNGAYKETFIYNRISKK